jgi:hypothetical protein
VAEFLTVLPEQHLPTIREWQRATWDEERQRYAALKYLLTTRIVSALHQHGIGLSYKYAARATTLWSRELVEINARGTQPRLATSACFMRLVGEYQQREGIDLRSAAVLELLGLERGKRSAVDDSPTRKHAHIKGLPLQRLLDWRDEILTQRGTAVSLASILAVQLIEGLERMGIRCETKSGERMPTARIRGGRSPTETDDRTHSYDYQVPVVLYGLCLEAAPKLGIPSADRYAVGRVITHLIMEASRLSPTLLQAEFTYGQAVVNARRRQRESERAASEMVYVERFLRLCKERTARDKWQRKGGVGRPPASTIDDHLGRTVHGPDANRIAADRANRHADMREHRQDVARRSVR